MPLNRRGSVSARLSVWFSRSSAPRNASRLGHEDLDAARIVRAQRRLAAHDVQRCPLLGARLGQHQRAVREVERRERVAAGELGARVSPSAGGRRSSGAGPARARPRARSRCACRAGGAPGRACPDGLERRIDGAQQERAREPDAFERPVQDARLERLEVDGDVGQLGHGTFAPSAGRLEWLRTSGAGEACQS